MKKFDLRKTMRKQKIRREFKLAGVLDNGEESLNELVSMMNDGCRLKGESLYRLIAEQANLLVETEELLYESESIA